MKKLIIFLAVFVLIASAVLATSSTTVFNDWISYDEDITYKDTTYFITAANVHLDDENKGQILIKKGTDRFMVAFGDCVEDITFEYCFENRSFGREEVDIDSQGRLQPALKVKLIESVIETELKKTKTFSQTKFLVEEEAEVTITLENTGDTDITNVLLKEIVPSNFEVIKSDSKASFIGNQLTTKINLFAGSEWTTTFTIRALESQEVKYSSLVTYDTESENGISETFGEKTLTFQDSYTLSVAKLKTVYDRTQKDTLSIKVTNKELVDITVDKLRIKVSDLVNVYSKKNVAQTTYNVYEAKGDIITPGETQTYEVSLGFNVVGNFSINYDLDLDVRGNKTSHEDEFETTVIIKGVECIISTNKEVFAGTDLFYELIVENNDDESFYELNGSYEFLNQGKEFFLPNVQQGSQQSVLQNRLTIPFSLEEKEYNATTKGKYRTVNNQFFDCDSTTTIIAKPAERLLSLELEFKERSTNRNESTIAYLEITNAIDTPIQEEIEIYFYSNEGNAEMKTIQGLIESQELEIEFAVNEFSRKEIANLQATAKIPSLNNYEDSINDTITINDPYDGEIVVEEIIEEKGISITEDLKERNNNKDELNFFQKIAYYFKNFFK